MSNGQHRPDAARVAARTRQAGSHGWRVDEKKYIRQGGTRCPFCGSDEIEGSSVEVDGGSAWQEVACNNCDSQWQDVYLLREINDLQDGGREPSDLPERALPGYPMAEGVQ
jgi:hypothetical protein